MVTDIVIRLFRKDPMVKRHLAKTISWRLIGSFDTLLLGWIITGQLSNGIKIGGMELATKMLLYFFHERVWHKVKFGIPSKKSQAENIKSENASFLFYQKGKVSKSDREALNGNKSFTIWLTGLSGSGKSTLGSELESYFHSQNLRSYVIDGDNTRLGINSDLSFSAEDRAENIRRVAEICKLFNDAGVIVIASFISPFEKDRLAARNIIGTRNFIETFVDASLDVCKYRDTKGLYKLAEEGAIKNFTGISSPYERPITPSIHVNTDDHSVEHCIKQITNYLLKNRVIEQANQLEMSM